MVVLREREWHLMWDVDRGYSTPPEKYGPYKIIYKPEEEK